MSLDNERSPSRTSSSPVSPRRHQLHLHRTPLGQSTLENMTGQTGPHSPVKAVFMSDSQTPSGRLPPPQSDSAPSSPASLQRQYAQLSSKLASVTASYHHLEDELARKCTLVDDLNKQMLASEQAVKLLKDERRKAEELLQKELAFYKDTIDELQRRNIRMSKKLEHDSSLSQTQSSETEEKYAKLYKSYKALQSNLELEQTLKALLIDQIEYLTKERDFLLQNTKAKLAPPDEDDQPYLDRSDILRTYETDLNENLDDSDLSEISGNFPSPQDAAAPNSHAGYDTCSSSDSESAVHGSQLLSSFDDMSAPHVLDTSSPVKDSLHGLMSANRAFQFPLPSQKPLSTNAPRLPPTTSIKRQSLPARLRANASFVEEDFVPSPLKLTTHANSSYFEEHSGTTDQGGKATISPSTKRRYSNSKPNHSRYNSHDIVPIKVEFEKLNTLRSTSAPDKEFLQHLASVEEAGPGRDDCDMAFMKLNGYIGAAPKRDSIITSSSKRSSLMTDINILTGDVTKQEITKLKFELQSLKLHNEKLLSYIGFELQKQKKNIKKLSSKQNLRVKNKSLQSQIEYSDAKLIEKSRNVLIHKKRVLRSVSINPILNQCVTSRDSLRLPTTIGIGIPVPLIDEDHEDEFEFKSHFMSSLDRAESDSLGGLVSLRSRGSRAYDVNRESRSGWKDDRTIKKFKSQTFGFDKENRRLYMDISSSEESLENEYDIEGSIGRHQDESLFEDHDPERDEWESLSESASSEIDYNQLDRFNQMKYLLLGKERLKKSKKLEAIADENLKYKFLTLVIGIAIVGIRFTTHSHTHAVAN